ncbi:unnamed protein product [Prunus armeniaca]
MDEAFYIEKLSDKSGNGWIKMVLDDELQALVSLSSLPHNWNTLVVSLSNSTLQGVLTLDIVKDSKEKSTRSSSRVRSPRLRVLWRNYQ